MATARQSPWRCQLLGRHDEVARVGFPYFGGIEHQHFPHLTVRDVLYTMCRPSACNWPMAAACWRDGVRPDGRQPRHRPRPAGHDRWQRRGRRRHRLRPAQALHPGLAGSHHRRAGRPGDPPGPRIRPERGQDPGPLDDHRRRRRQPLVPHGHDLPRPDQPADPVRVRRSDRRRLGALCRPGKAASADRLDAAGLRAWTGTARRAT